MKRLLVYLLLCTQAIGAVSIINSFNGGELSPLLEGRTDIEKYYSGCRDLQNFIATTYGAAVRRPGTKYIASAKTRTVACRLVSFEFNTDQAYIIEFGNLYCRFYRDSGQIQSGGSAYEITTPYLTADLFELQFAQSSNTLYIVHSDHEPATLTRADHDDWTLADITFERGPFLDLNITDTTVTPSAITGSITVQSSAALWESDHVGALWEITHVVDSNSTDGSFAADGNSASVAIELNRTYDFSSHGTWNGTLSLQRSYDDGTTWRDVIIRHYEGDGNIQYTDTETIEDADYRLNMSSYVSGTCNYNLTARTHELAGVAQITAYTDPCNVSATVVNTLGGTTATELWSEGSWSDEEGWPGTVAFYEERVSYAGTENSPQTIWMSKTGDWNNFKAGANDDDALIYTIASDRLNRIRWIAQQNVLLLGTAGGEWRISGASSSQAITPTNVSIRQQSSYGSAFIQSIVTDNVVIYAQRKGRKVRELTYSFDLDSWISPDMTVLAEHITDSGITEMALQRMPDPILWCVLDDGGVAAMTYNREEKVIGWHDHVIGDVESVAVIPGDEEDEVWFSVKRTIRGADYRYIEQMQPRDWGTDQSDAFFVDSGLTYDGGAAATISYITQADPAVITASNSFTDGDQVRITDVSGMTELNDKVWTVQTPTSSNFRLRDKTDAVDINSVGFTGYTSGGSVVEVENIFTTLSHLDLETVDVQADGGYYGSVSVNSSTVTLTDFYNTVHIGLNYESKLKPMKLEGKGSQTQGLIKRISHATVRMHNTLGLEIGDSYTNTSSFLFRGLLDPLEAPTPLFTGDKRIAFLGSYTYSGDICLLQDKPLPCTILSIIPTWELEK